MLAALGPGLAGAGAAEYEIPGTLQPGSVLPKGMAAGPNYRVQNPVVSDGYMYRFSVKSDFGPFEVTGMGALRKLVREIGAIAALRNISKSKAFAEAVKSSATSPLRLARSLITNPVDTVSGVPKGVYKLMEEVGESATETRDQQDDPAYQKVLLASGNKRQYASRLGVDVYSSNTVLQKDLNRISWAAAAGNLTVSAAFAPIGGAAGAALSGVRWSNAINEQLTAEPAPRLRIINEGKLSTMGIPADLTKRFLDHQRFSPRHKTILVESLAGLGQAKGRERFLEAALVAEDEVDANFFTAAAQMLRGYHETVSHIAEIRTSRRLALAQAENGTVFIPLPLDHMIWTQRVDQRSQEFKAAPAAAGGGGKVELWLTGTLSQRARKELQGRGYTVAEEVGKRIPIMD